MLALRGAALFAALVVVTPAFARPDARDDAQAVALVTREPSRFQKFLGHARALIHAPKVYFSGMSGTLHARVGRRFGGYRRALRTAERLSDERLRKMPDHVRADLASALLRPALFGDRERGSRQFLRVIMAEGRDPGNVLDMLSRLDNYDSLKIGRRLRGPAKREFQALVGSATARPGDWAAFHNFADAATETHERPNNRVKLLIDGNTYFPTLSRAIDNAKHFVLAEKFAVHSDRAGRSFLGDLVEAARRNVFTTMLYDRVGSVGADPRLFNQLDANGGKAIGIHSRRLLGSHVSHRKLVVTDGKDGPIGFIGGMNVGTDYRDVWHDVHSRVTGPVVADMAGALLQQARANGGKIPRRLRRAFKKAAADAPVADDDDPSVRFVPHTGFRDQHEKLLYIRAIDTSSKRVLIENPYMTDSDVVTHLALAAGRGVDVRLILPNRSDNRLLKIGQRSNYKRLLDYGVKIFEYVGKDLMNPQMSHGKVAVFDDEVATLGSSNLDARSLRNNDEANLWFRDKRMAKRLTKQLFERDLQRSIQIRAYRPGPLMRLNDHLIRFLERSL